MCQAMSRASERQRPPTDSPSSTLSRVGRVDFDIRNNKPNSRMSIHVATVCCCVCVTMAIVLRGLHAKA